MTRRFPAGLRTAAASGDAHSLRQGAHRARGRVRSSYAPPTFHSIAPLRLLSRLK
ncbi:hypothetical protein ACH4TX_32220 [Streptomyces sp. NPDC021098]|uniref:hypothetical protein n=1 Tax=unclassified Streptomyces TaxID=2593676 RepID=UPI00378B2F42